MDAEMDSFPPVPRLLGGSPTWVAQLRTAPRLVWCREEISSILSCDSIDRWLEASLHLASLLRQENTVGLFCFFFLEHSNISCSRRKEDVAWRSTKSVSSQRDLWRGQTNQLLTQASDVGKPLKDPEINRLFLNDNSGTFQVCKSELCAYHQKCIPSLYVNRDTFPFERDWQKTCTHTHTHTILLFSSPLVSAETKSLKLLQQQIPFTSLSGGWGMRRKFITEGIW